MEQRLLRGSIIMLLLSHEILVVLLALAILLADLWMPPSARRNLGYAGYVDLASKDEVYELIRDCIQKVNLDLADDPKLAGSQITRFVVLHKELDADDGELTRTRKVRRRIVAEKYARIIEALYSSEDHVEIEALVKFEDGRSGMVSAHLKIEDAKTFAAIGQAA